MKVTVHEIHDQAGSEVKYFGLGEFGNIAVYFGNLLIEFRCAGGGYDPEYHIPIMDMYIYGTYDDIYEYNMNGVPYKFLDDVCLSIPNVRSKEEFQAEFEEEILDLLNERPELIKEAIKETEVEGWRK